jgi:hypothetical protein
MAVGLNKHVELILIQGSGLSGVGIYGVLLLNFFRNLCHPLTSAELAANGKRFAARQTKKPRGTGYDSQQREVF